jgi:hypothetical protein
MGLLDKAKDVGKRGVDVGKKAGKAGIDLGKKGVDTTKEAVRKKTCDECKHYTPIDEEKGDCPIAGQRLASADNITCPQKAFEPK